MGSSWSNGRVRGRRRFRGGQVYIVQRQDIPQRETLMSKAKTEEELKKEQVLERYLVIYGWFQAGRKRRHLQAKCE